MYGFNSLGKDVIQKPARVLMIFMFSFLVLSCSNNTGPYNPPSSHTVNKNGILHRPGLTDPLTNCVSCHGSDLKGGNVGVSCTECHGKKW